VVLAEKCADKGQIDMILELTSSIAEIEMAIEGTKRPAG
jgi:hypothetical protein